MSSDEERHFQLEHLSFPSRVPPLKGLNKYIDYYYPGLAPWAMQECRPKGLLYHEILINYLIILIRLPYL